MNTLQCSKCKQIKKIDDFSINNQNTKRFFRNGKCKICDNQIRKLRSQQRRESNIDENMEQEEKIMTYREIAEQIGCRKDTVIACERRAIDKLKTSLTQLGIYSASDLI